jgi:tetratricopeptide (TPR) repeat protein
MKHRLLFPLLLLPALLASQTVLYASTDPAYIRNIDEADALFEAESYREAIPFYRRALDITDEAYRSKFRLAFCYLLTGEYASAGAWLRNCAERHPGELCVLHVFEEESALYRYRLYLDWLGLQRACLDGLPAYSHWARAELAEIRHFDQLIRSENRLPNASDCAGKAHYWPGMSFRQVDSVNEVRLAAIIHAVGGYPGLDVVGAEQSGTAWLVIQHAPIEYQERYHPLVEEAALSGQTSMGNWAYLVDRMRMNRREKQVYGSQMWVPDRSVSEQYELYPLEDPHNVNQRRAEVGLGPIEDYIARWGVKFEPDKMK